MKALKWLVAILSTYLIIFGAGYKLVGSNGALLEKEAAVESSSRESAPLDRAARDRNPPTAYRLDASRSKFMAHADRSGLLWFKGHGHHIAVREFTGEAVLDPDSLANSSLQITAKAASMEETGSVFTAPQKEIINKELREIVLLPDQYPDIVFRSTGVTGKSTGAGQYDLKIAGNLTLHGVTRPVTIPTKVNVSGDEMRAQGEFSIDRSDFNVKATSAFHGMVRVSNKVKFEFDIVGHSR